MRFLIHGYRPDDAAATLAVFQRSVTGLATHDYNPEQIRTWSSHPGSVRQWHRRRSAVHTWAAVPENDSDTIVGFIDVDDTGYIDMLFVDPVHARQGVASMLLSKVERHATEHGTTRLCVHASITARPFFEHHGFHVEQVRHPSIGSVSFINYLMARP